MNIMKSGGDITVRGVIAFDDDAKCFEAYCPELNVRSAGKTSDDAKRALRSAVNMWKRFHEKRGTLKHALLKRGIYLADTEPFSIEVPIKDTGYATGSQMFAPA